MSISIEQANAMMSEIFAPWIQQLAMEPVSVSDTEAVLRLPANEALRHVGGVICGQVFMSAADTAMVIAISSALGGFRPMTTVSLNTSFMRPVIQGDLTVTARILRLGRSLVFGEIEIAGIDGRTAVHATTTYALL